MDKELEILDKAQREEKIRELEDRLEERHDCTVTINDIEDDIYIRGNLSNEEIYQIYFEINRVKLVLDGR